MSWLATIVKNANKKLDEIKFSECFPKSILNDINQKISAGGFLSDFSFTWKNLQEYKADSGTELCFLEVSVASLKNHIFLLLPKNNIMEICSGLFGNELSSDESFFKSFINFLYIEMLANLREIAFIKNLSLTLIDIHATAPEEKGLCLPVICSFKDKISFNSKIIFSPRFQTEWKNFWINQKEMIDERNKKISVMKVEISLRAGRTKLSDEELSSIEVGDWIAIDDSNFNSENGTAKVYINSQNAYIGDGLFDGNVLKVLSFSSTVND